VILPVTTFSQRADAITREPFLQDFWSTLPGKLSEARAGASAPPFVLHDGPPYANGDLHIGHALNKILKDVVNRRALLKGFDVQYVPGWDCHGLPIELKVLQSMKASERKDITPATLRQKAAVFANEAVDKQSKSFQRYGVYGDFSRPYKTLDKEYEAAQISVFGDMFKNGHIYRGRKPVHWSPSSRTALAEAELEYPNDHFSRSVYVKMPITELSPSMPQQHDDLSLAIWTTTPWTMPANLAIAVNADLSYSVVSHPDVAGNLVVATDLVSTLAEKLKLPHPFTVHDSFPGSSLSGTKYKHPLYERTSPVLIGGDYITTESGTGLVHTAPGHGVEDYQTGLKAGLELLSPVDDAGKFTEEAGPRFQGLSVLAEGNQEVITALNETGALLLEEKYKHKYPYDWRTKKPTIFRATSQWFASVEGFRGEALDAVESVKWVPAGGKTRMRSFVEGRNDWCISRQRSWGVPIPVFYDESGENVLATTETIDHIQKVFEEHGSDAWFTMTTEELLPDSLKADAHKWTRGKDTMDVWFDSGSSWAGVLQKRPNLTYPADVYLEGSDQHRGWFQSSLLTSVAAKNCAPYKTVITHGFVLDEKGYKMSKSLGNVVSPLEVIEGGNNRKQKPAYGADLLRLWVASVDYSGDVRVGDQILKQTFESQRKLRNTARFVLGNLNDFDPAKHAVPFDELPSLDKYVLGLLSETLKEVDAAYENFEYSRVVNALLRFCTADLSNFYLDASKDRLYISEENDERRRSCQTTMSMVLDGITLAMAPILPHLAEDIWLNRVNMPGESENSRSSVFEQLWPVGLEKFEKHDAALWDKIRVIRDDANKIMERARMDKQIGASMDASLVVHVPAGDELGAALSAMTKEVNGVDTLRYALVISEVNIVSDVADIASACGSDYVVEAASSTSGYAMGLRSAKAAGMVKCERCWYFTHDLGIGEGCAPDLCGRCDSVIKRSGFVRPPSTK
jgi:isoleucyl-tRNA synthetase